MGVISCAGIIVNAKEYDAATNAALATAGPGSTPGRKLAALLLDFLCCLADMGQFRGSATGSATGSARTSCA